jgi:hypothetical protein
MEQNYSNKQEPPRRLDPKPINITVTVVIDPLTKQPVLRLDPPTVDLTIEQQAAWTSKGGRLEIRFAPSNTPFVGAMFRAANGGTILSGAPTRTAISTTPYPYTLLVTTPDGFFIKQDEDLRAVDDSTGPRPGTGGNQGKGCLTLLGFGLLYGMISKLRAML